MASNQPQIGHRFKNVGTPFRTAVWVLTEIFVGPDGIDHARLTSAYDATERKTIALSVVADSRRFTLAEASRK